MKKQKIQLPEMKLIGLTTRTNNKNEMVNETAKIGKLASLYWGNQQANNIKHRSKPGVTYAIYTDFENHEYGDYTYFIGETVDSFESQDLAHFKKITVPASTYQKFTTTPGKMPDVVISAWQAIWKMKEGDFGGKRKYVADFEIYDDRVSDQNNAIVDIYIGIEG